MSIASVLQMRIEWTGTSERFLELRVSGCDRRQPRARLGSSGFDNLSFNRLSRSASVPGLVNRFSSTGGVANENRYSTAAGLRIVDGTRPHVLRSCEQAFKRGRAVHLRESSAAMLQRNFLLSAASLYQEGLEPPYYNRFVEHAIEQSRQRMILNPFPMKTEYKELVAKDGKAVTNSFAFQSEKIRQFRAAAINGGRTLQVLNLVVFPSAAYDLPIFCADLVTFAKCHVIVLDLNPLYNPDSHAQYKEKYISPLSPLWKKYHEILPWGGEITTEAVQFFSPFVLWSRPIKEERVDDVVFDAFKDYYNAWLEMVDKAEASIEADVLYKNQEAQHRYMSWRSTKDPGRNLLTRLYGETFCEEYMKDFLFAELESMGSKSFLDYFPQFKDQNGFIQKQRSVAGKIYPARPWDENGNRICPELVL